MNQHHMYNLCHPHPQYVFTEALFWHDIPLLSYDQILNKTPDTCWLVTMATLATINYLKFCLHHDHSFIQTDINPTMC